MNYSKNHQQWIEALKTDFEGKKRLWQGSLQSYQNKIRQTQLEHFSHFLDKGFPSDKNPYWKFTNINSFLKSVFSLKKVSPTSFEDTSHVSFFSLPQSHKIHFHNGVLKESSLKNLPEGVQFCKWEDLTPDFPAWAWIKQTLKKKGDGFYHLAGALPSCGYVLFIGKMDLPLHIHFSFDESFQGDRSSVCSSLWNLRNFIFLTEQADITFIESVSTSKPMLVNSVTSVKTSQDSSLKWLHIDQGQSDSFYLNQVHCDMEELSSMNRLGFSLGSGLSRDTVEVWHLGEKAHSVLLGLSILKQKVLRDQRFYVHHLQKEGYSRQFSRGVLNDQAKNVFHGKVHVDSKATQTDCAQSAKNLLLSSTADAYTQPEMEINCGEVKAQHGATTGPLSRDEIFYLQSRGLEYRAAVEFLIMAYITDVLNQFPDKNLVQHLTQDIWESKNRYLNL
ncbi:MAG: SufD family Fe-S cluster assembly protein [Oligoflexia bacterium]|nr:SufD family Fe-S cluster assembly protein [Bdellovibrionales bacterium]MYE07901.1 SufD family Fe-S cluster assembly protein [Oligoflexia bacterium]